MKINKYILGAGALLCMMLPAASAQAQDVKLKCMEWNIKSFEYDDNSNAVYFEIAEAMEKIKAENPDIVCFNEFETATGRMSSVEKLTECAQSLGMFPFFVFSYDKDNGAYGNGILSKYPIVNSASVLLGMYTGADQRSAGWADILVPTDSKPEGVKVRIVCTHLDAFGGDETCLGQAKEVIEHAIAPAVAENIPVLIMGDMNCGPSSSAIREYEKTGTRHVRRLQQVGLLHQLPAGQMELQRLQSRQGRPAQCHFGPLPHRRHGRTEELSAYQTAKKVQR